MACPMTTCELAALFGLLGVADTDEREMDYPALRVGAVPNPPSPRDFVLPLLKDLPTNRCRGQAPGQPMLPRRALERGSD